MELTTPVGGGSSTTTTTATGTVGYEGDTEEEIAEHLITRLLDMDKVALGLESCIPDKAKIDALDQALRNLAKSDAEGLVDTKKLLDHRKQLESGGSATRLTKIQAIETARKQFNYVAVVGDFTCNNSPEAHVETENGNNDGGVCSISLRVCDVVLSVRVPLSDVKPHWQPYFRDGIRRESVMVFGQIESWQSDPPRLAILPLVIAPNWT
jgi:hypothetical protein